MTSSKISRGKNFRDEAKRWYDNDCIRLGLSLQDASAYVYAWHEENDPDCCKIGYCTKDPFTYIWDGSALSHQRRLPVIFLVLGVPNAHQAKVAEETLHQHFRERHLNRATSREWFKVSKSEIVEYVRTHESDLLQSTAPLPRVLERTLGGMNKRTALPL